jgi:hypothetical protein
LKNSNIAYCNHVHYTGEGKSTDESDEKLGEAHNIDEEEDAKKAELEDLRTIETIRLEDDEDV